MESKELMRGKAAEHLVVADLLLLGYEAFLSEQGMYLDAIVMIGGKPKTLQIKSTHKLINTDKAKNIYRFAIRSGREGDRRIDARVDIFAFVALDIKAIAYMSKQELMSKDGTTYVTTLDFKSRLIEYDAGRVYPNGTVRKGYGRYLQDYQYFDKLLERNNNEI